MTDDQMFKKKLQSDPLYQRIVAGPLKAMKKEAEEILKSVDSTDGQIRYAQGMCKVLDWHEWIFEQNDAQILAQERKKKEQSDARSRKPNYAYGKYSC